MTVIKIEEVKKFMGTLLNSDTFDGFLCKGAEVVSNCTYSVDGRLNSGFFDEKPEREYALYSEIRPVLFELIKGKRTPVKISLILMKNRDDESEKESPENMVSSKYLNIHFEKGELNISTGVSYSGFTLSKSGEYEWDNEAQALLKRLQIC